jgi:arylsulfatase A-like enzyme
MIRSLLLFSFCATLAQAKPPNIILFLVDDMGWSDSSVYGSTFYETPSMERLAKQGMRFSAAYVQPLCSPTRATLLTGKDAPTRFQMHQAITGKSAEEATLPEKSRPDSPANWPGSSSALPLEETTIAERLRDGGYQTWHLGKWHLGNSAKFGPQHQGFQIVRGAAGAGPGRSYFGTEIPLLSPGPKEEYITERLTTEACKLLDERDPAKPFFMHFAHFNVHSPYNAKPELIAHFKKKADPKNQHHNPVMAAMLRSMDDSLGTLLDKLDQLNLSSETVFIFLSDNGGIHWKNRMPGGLPEMPPTSNAPLRGGKCCFYEGGIRVPMLVRWPGRTPAASTCDTPVHAADFFPTARSIAGSVSDNADLDGIDITPLLEGKSMPPRPLYGHFPRAKTLADTVGGSWIREGDFKLIRLWFAGPDRTHTYELYQLKEDIGETKNLAPTMPDLVNQLAAKLDNWLGTRNALIPTPNPNYKP